MTSAQTVFITLTSTWISTGQIVSASTSVAEFSNRTVTTVRQLEFAGRLPPTNGTNTCISDHHSLSGLGEGLVVRFSFVSDAPMDFYVLSESAFSAWSGAGAHCGQITNPMIERHEGGQLSPFNFTTPAAGDYEVLVVNTSSNSWADYVIAVAYPASVVETQSSSIFLVTLPATFTSSLVFAVRAVVFHPSMTSQIINLIPILLVLAFVVVIADLLRREIKQRRKKPESMTQPAPQEIPKSEPPS
jgi:hypothetical protein